MGSYSQVVVGIMLLVVAFFFGRYINQKPITDEKAIAEQQEVVGAISPVGTDEQNEDSLDGGSQQRSLRERILEERQVASSSSTNHPAMTSQAVAEHVEPDFNAALVEPDFSHLQSGIELATANPNPLNQTPVIPQTTNREIDSIAEPVSRPKTNRFSINYPRHDRPHLQDRRRLGDRLIERKIDQMHSVLKPGVRSGQLSNKNRQNQTDSGAEIIVDNPRYRMVPVRERIGRWKPEPIKYSKYTTVFGDTLHSLSTKFFGTPKRYMDIYLANHDLLESPTNVPVNTEIRIPVFE